jgi:hypothetical protein
MIIEADCENNEVNVIHSFFLLDSLRQFCCWGQSYKAFYARNLRKASVFVRGKPFQPSVMFVGKASS